MLMHISSIASSPKSVLTLLDDIICENRDVSSCDYALTSRGYSLISKTVYGSYLEESWILRCPGVQLYTVNNTETANNLF